MRRKKKTAETAAERSPEEQALVDRYPHQKILPGSWRAAGERPGSGHKRTVIVTCCVCDAERVLATSDLQWPTTKFCIAHAKDAKKNRKETGKVKKGLK